MIYHIPINIEVYIAVPQTMVSYLVVRWIKIKKAGPNLPKCTRSQPRAGPNIPKCRRSQSQAGPNLPLCRRSQPQAGPNLPKCRRNYNNDDYTNASYSSRDTPDVCYCHFFMQIYRYPCFGVFFSFFFI